jgi:inosine-uridine nucleoside N-ribohydrolase
MIRTLLALFTAASVATAAPVKIIFDTDMGNDVDDVMALMMIHQLQARGACELLAVTVTKDHALAGPFTDAINTFCGAPNTLIGTVRNGATKEMGRFNMLADKKHPDGSFVYPHDLLTSEQAPEAVGLLRKLLAQQPDKSVRLVQVGFFTNFARLLDSPPDEASPLSGKDLIAQKVEFLSLMAGTFQTVEWRTRHLEYNVVQDIPSAQKLAKEWPTPMVWSGYEIGVACPFPHQSVVEDMNYVEHHPLKEAYYLYEAPPHNRPTWDPTALLYAIFPERGYFDLSPKGNIGVLPDGETRFWLAKEGKDEGKHRFLLVDDKQREKVREAIVQLCVQPPVVKR